MRKDPSELVGEGAFVKTKKTIGKLKVQGLYVILVGKLLST